MRRLLCVLVVTLAARSGVRADDLLTIYEQARAADPVLAGARAQRGVQQATVDETRASLLPQWSIGLSERVALPDNLPTQALQTTLTQTLVDLATWRTLASATHAAHAEDARVRAAEQALCMRVASAYFEVLTAQAVLSAARTNEAAYARQVAEAQARYEAGLTALVDLEQARAYLELSRVASVEADQYLSDARAALRELTGRTPGELQPLAATWVAHPPVPSEPGAWIHRAVADNPALHAAAHELAASAEQVAAASAAHWPSLGLQLTSGKLDGGALAQRDRQLQGVASLTLELPLLTGGALSARAHKADFQRRVSEAQLGRARRALERETRLQYQAVVAGITRIQASTAAVAAAGRAVAAARSGQALGTLGMIDLLIAIQVQGQAQNTLTVARHGYVLATLFLRRAVGALGPAELATVNRLLEGAS